MRKLITAGTGTYASIGSPGDAVTGGDDWVTSAASPDGQYLVAYIPDAHGGSISIDATVLRGAAEAQWFDPSSGTYSSAGRVTNTDTQSFTPPGSNSGLSRDWVLLVAAS